jgi:hypothetical protein
MRTGLQVVLVVAMLVLVGATDAAAQRRAPAADMWAVAGSIGAGAPADPSLHSGVGVTGSIERYLTPRASIRGQLGGAWFDIVGRHFTGSVSPVFFDGNLVYNWEGGVWHPFVTGGVGVYRARSAESGTAGSADTRPGVDLGGGLEYFSGRRVAITTEVLYHVVSEVHTPLATFTEGQFWTVGVGVKRYF